MRVRRAAGMSDRERGTSLGWSDRGGIRRVNIGYLARPQLKPLHDRSTRWGIVIAHRRAGKTVACVADLIGAAARCPLPNPRFAYVAPYLNQAKDIAWNYLQQY